MHKHLILGIFFFFSSPLETGLSHICDLRLIRCQRGVLDHLDTLEIQSNLCYTVNGGG